MSGLFATLVEAATGRGEAVRPPPRARFAPADDLELPDELPEVQTERRRQPPAEVGRRSGPAGGEIHEPRPPVPDDAQALLPPGPVAAAEPAHRRRESSRDGPAPAGKDPGGEHARRGPAARSEQTGPDGPHQATAHAPTGDLHARTGPVGPERSSREQVSAEPGPPRPEQSSPRPSAAPVEIRIERIEVNPPLPATSIRAASPPHRPVRAAPRQSLSDYLSARRR